MIMEDMNLTEEQYQELEERVPDKRRRPSVVVVEVSSEEEDGSLEPESEDSDEEMVDQLEDDESQSEPLASSSNAAHKKKAKTRTRRSSRMQDLHYSTTPPLIQPRPSKGSRTTQPTPPDPPKSSIRVSTTPIAQSHSKFSHYERVLKELGSIQSKLDGIDGTIKAALAVPVKPVRRSDNKENIPLAEKPTVDARLNEEPSKTQGLEGQMLLDTVCPSDISGAEHSNSEPQLGSRALTDDDQRSIIPTATHPTVMITGAEGLRADAVTDTNGPQHVGGLEYDQLGDSGVPHDNPTPPGVLPSIATIDLTLPDHEEI